MSRSVFKHLTEQDQETRERSRPAPFSDENKVDEVYDGNLSFEFVQHLQPVAPHFQYI